MRAPAAHAHSAVAGTERLPGSSARQLRAAALTAHCADATMGLALSRLLFSADTLPTVGMGLGGSRKRWNGCVA